MYLCTLLLPRRIFFSVTPIIIIIIIITITIATTTTTTNFSLRTYAYDQYIAMGFVEEAEGVAAPPPSSPTPDMIASALQSSHLSPSAANSTTTAAPQLPPSMDAYRNLSSAEIIADLNKTPLFMTDLEENDELEAFKALAYEGTPSEVAGNFKEQGNDVFKLKRWADAKEFYTKAINVLLSESRNRAAAKAADTTEPQSQSQSSEDTEELAEQRKLLEACLGNRSACHVQLQNYRSATLDCAHVLRLNPQNVKALYRSGVALLALDKIAEADDACARGLTLDPTHKDLLRLADQIVAKAEEADRKRKKTAAAELRRKQEVYVLRAALQAREIKTRSTAQPPEMEDARIRLVPDAVDPTSMLVFPTVLLYPLKLQSDFVKEFAETETLGSRLDVVLGERAEWDAQGEYTPRGVECYMETPAGGLVKVGRGASLLKVLSGGKVEVVDQVVRVFVVPTPKAATWVEEFKRKKKAERGEA
jgi:tetratricopeptide (TPR) repeat protein